MTLDSFWWTDTSQRDERLARIRARRGTPEREAANARLREQMEQGEPPPRPRYRRPLQGRKLEAAAVRLLTRFEKVLAEAARDNNIDPDLIAYDVFVSWAPMVESRPEVIQQARLWAL